MKLCPEKIKYIAIHQIQVTKTKATTFHDQNSAKFRPNKFKYTVWYNKTVTQYKNKVNMFSPVAKINFKQQIKSTIKLTDLKKNYTSSLYLIKCILICIIYF